MSALDPFSAHFHRCPHCCEDRLCCDTGCHWQEEEDFVRYGGPFACERTECQILAEREEAMERLGRYTAEIG